MPRLMSETGTDAAFAELLARTRPRALAFLRRLCGAEAEDVLHDALAKLWRYRGAWDPARNGESWVLRSAFRAFLDWRARRERAPVADDAAIRARGTTPSCPAEIADELRIGLARLSPIERELVLGFPEAGRSLVELARAHGLPLNTVKSHLHRARRRLAGGTP